MKFIAVCILMGGLAQVAAAQSDSLYDVLPLALGNRWNYYFYLVNAFGHTSSTQQGPEELQIIDMIPSSDSTIWRFRQRRNVTNILNQYGEIYTWTSQDSAIFDLVELNDGRHEVYTPAYSDVSIFPFQKSSAESSQFFRYRMAASAGDVSDTIVIPYPNVPSLYHVFFTLRPNTGISHAQGSRLTSFPGNWMSMQYDLQSFRPSFPGPHLRLPDSTKTIKALFGESGDSLIALENGGVKPVTISRIDIPDSRFSIIQSLSSIPPISTASIIVRFSSSVAETVQAHLVVQSDSPTSPDTIRLTGVALAESRVRFTRDTLHFPATLIDSSRLGSFTIINTGNVPLTILSTQINYFQDWGDWFTVERVTTSIAPRDSAPLNVRFHPVNTGPTTGNIWGSVRVATNALNSLYTLQVHGIYVSRIPVLLSTRMLDFDTVFVGQTKDLVVDVSQSSENNVPIMEFVRRAPAAGAYGVQTRSFPPNLPWGEIFRDTIRFAPAYSGRFADTLRYETKMLGILTSSDTVYLRGFSVVQPQATPATYALIQNYPNPFNPSTTIRYSLAHTTLVSLIVYNMLGQEIAHLVNEEQEAGFHEAEFRGEGLPSGVYFYRLRAGEFSETKKLLIVR